MEVSVSLILEENTLFFINHKLVCYYLSTGLGRTNRPVQSMRFKAVRCHF